jgi:hypothetical protein
VKKDDKRFLWHEKVDAGNHLAVRRAEAEYRWCPKFGTAAKEFCRDDGCPCLNAWGFCLPPGTVVVPKGSPC